MTTTARNDAARLKEILDQRGIPKQDFFMILARAGYRSHNTQASFIDKNEKPEIPKNDLCLICSLFGLCPEDFDYPSDYFRSPYSQKGAALYCYNHLKEGDKDYRPFTENFFLEVNKHLLQVEKELLVCDYIDKVRGIGQKENTDYYHARDTEYYAALETRLAQKPIAYKRIIQVPLGVPVRDFGEGVEFVIEEMFAESFEHLCKCLRDFKKQCEFKVIIRPFRLHTYYLVDGEVALTEYHRYDLHGIPMPDTLFINVRNPSEPDAVGSIYMKACLHEFRRMLNSPSNKDCKLTKPIVVKSVMALEEKIRKEIAELGARLDHEDRKAQEEMGGGAQIPIFDQYTSLNQKVVQALEQWDQDEKHLDTLKERYENVREKRQILCEVFNLQLPPGLQF